MFYRRNLQAATWLHADVTEFEAYHFWDVTHTWLET
jgi:hypothetical protein